MTLIAIRVIGYALSIGSIAAMGWWVYDKIGDGAVAAFQRGQLLQAMEIDDREDRKVDSVLSKNRADIHTLRKANDVLARTLSIKFNSDPCWNQPVPDEFIRMHQGGDGQGVQATPADPNPANP